MKLLFIPEKHELIAFLKGDGCNLIEEDYEKGYDSYVNYGQIKLCEEIVEALAAGDEISPTDAGMFLYNSEKLNVDSNHMIDALLEHIYGRAVEYSVIS